MSQSDNYKNVARVDYLADMVGGDVAQDILKTVIETVEDQIDVEDRADRDLGKVDVADTDLTLPTEQQTPVGVENTSGTAVNPATEGTLSSTLSREIATWSAGTLPVEQQTPVSLENTSGTAVNPATEGTLSSTLSREIATWSAGTLPVEQQTPVQLEDSTGTNIDPATDSTLSNTLTREIATWSAGTLSTNVTDRDGRNLGDVDVTSLDEAAPKTDTASGTTESNAAVVDLGSTTKDFDVFYDTSGAATITIEVSKDNATWRPLQQIQPSSADSDIAQFDTSYRYVRAYIDQNRNALEISAKGV
jgi:hypothetical protein